MKNSLLRTKPVERILGEAKGTKGGLKRVLTAVDLTAIGVGAIIGAGIFVLTGTAAREVGPIIMCSYLFAGIACILAAFCYTEFATRLPISGSAYTYAYASVGEIIAWIIGWDLILEYTIGASTVAVGWTHYLSEFLKGFHILVPDFLLSLPVGPLHLNLAAGILVALLTVLLCIGIKESARFNAVMVVIKLAVVLFVIFAGMHWVQPANWSPFSTMGLYGIPKGASMIFFAYIGFDAVSTAAEEVKNPQRDLPIGIIASLSLCTVLYIAVAAVITGMVPFAQIDSGAPLAAAFGNVGDVLAQKLIGLGGFVGLTTVVLILLMSQPRIWFSMARDGLIVPWFAQVHEKFRTPFNASIVAGLIAMLMAVAVPLEDLHYMVSIGTLFAFVVVSASVLISRFSTPEADRRSVVKTVLGLVLGYGLLCFGLTQDFSAPVVVFEHVAALKTSFYLVPDVSWIWPVKGLLIAGGGLLALMGSIRLAQAPQNAVIGTFKCPWVPFLPIVAIVTNLYMMVTLSADAWLRLWIWLAIGLLIYALYGRKHSKLAEPVSATGEQTGTDA